MDNPKPSTPPLPYALVALPIANGWVLLDVQYYSGRSFSGPLWSGLDEIPLRAIFAVCYTHATVAAELHAWAQRRYPELVA